MRIKISVFNKAKLFLLLVFVTLTFQFCKSSKNATSNKKDTAISYTKSIAPIIEKSCTPCHFPEKGKKKLLDSYNAIKNNIEDILVRVQLPETNEKYMPFKGKREPLTKEEIGLLKKWVAQGMSE